MAKFETRDGLAFERLEDGQVQITATQGSGTRILDAEEWASVVAHVSAAGGTPAAFHVAQELHRSAVTGRFVTAEEATANPSTTVTEHD